MFKKNLALLTILVWCSFPLISKAQNWPKPANVYSWEGTWTPSFPIPNMYDDYYYDGHEQSGKITPVLPPGTWDWGNEQNLANYKNYQSKIGHFATMMDNQNRIFGWKVMLDYLPAEFTAGAAYFTGSPGADIVDLGAGSSIHSTGEIGLGDGPDILRFEKGYSLYITTGSSFDGAKHDNDLVIAGQNSVPANGATDISQASIVTGPGRDLVFVNNMASAGVDVGCGAGGRTDTTDPNDGDDIVVYGGNMNDFRFVGGNGNDLAVWYADEVQQQAAGWTWLGPNFFGGGAWGNALWEDAGSDRLIMVIPTSTTVNNQKGAPNPGELNVYTLNNYSPKVWIDGPTETDVYARYCITCGIGPEQKKTITLEYASANGKVFTGQFWLTAFEELQIGIGAGARVYKLDAVNGKAILDNALLPISPPLRSIYNQVASNYIAGLSLNENPVPGYAPTQIQIKNLSAYPNPANEQLIVQFITQKAINCTFSLVDIIGRVVLSEKMNAGQGENYHQLNLKGLSTGVYVLNLQEGEIAHRTKVIIE